MSRRRDDNRTLPEPAKTPITNVSLGALQQHYTIRDGDSRDGDSLVIELLEEEPALFALLTEATRPLRSVFGEGPLLHVRGQLSDDYRLLKVTVHCLPISAVI